MTDAEHERKRVIELIERLIRRHKDNGLLRQTLSRLLYKIKHPKLNKDVNYMIDYAKPTMLAENALSNLHNAMLEKRYDDALEFALQALAETKLAYHAIVVMKENDPYMKAK